MKNYKFTIKGQTYEVQINNFEGNQVDVEVNGTVYKVGITEDIKLKKTPTIVRKPITNKPGEGKLQKKESTGLHKIKAPLPGSIFKMNVKPGDTVIKGQTLLVMEAMKMENNIMADKPGTIKEIKVNVGDSVLQDDLLLEMEL